MTNEDKNLLLQIAMKKIETTMIGCLARFETAFGHLWGHAKHNDNELTEQELYFDDLWQEVRNNILNHGNNQSRSLYNDFNKILQDKPQVKFSYKFPFKNEEKNS
jgi:hypothetical protein